VAVPDPSRRAFLGRMAGALGAFLAAAIGVPLAGAALAPAARRDEGQWIVLGSEGEFGPGEPRMITFGSTRADAYIQATVSRAVWVYRAPDGLRVYNGRCTHLGCLVTYRSSSRTFLCPCHGGVFDVRNGAVLDGPPPRPLDQLENRVDRGELSVNYRDFLVGVPEQRPL
jgi:menaquinol-cytochrome c reductase iron-sulfur subunit